MTTERIVFTSEDFLILYKESGLDTVPLKRSTGPTLLSFAAEEYPEVAAPFSDNYWEGGVLHRLDRGTSGLVLVARKKSFFDKMIEEQRKGRFEKRYVAVTDERNDPLPPGFPLCPFEFTPSLISSSFRAYGVGRKEVRPVLSDGKAYYTKITGIEGKRVFVTLRSGFRHQIRAHLAWLSHPIDGDELYKGRYAERLMLESTGLSFLGFTYDIKPEI